MRLCVGHQHSRFLSVLSRFVDYYSLFWGPRVISTINQPRVRLRVGHQHSQFWPILARFVLCWGPGVISTINEPRGAFTCQSSTLIVLADSCPFHGLLLTLFGLGLIFPINEPRGASTCRSSTLIVLADSGPFRGVLLTVFVSQSDFHNLQTPGCIYVSVMNIHSFGVP